MVSHFHKDIITNAIRVLRARRVRPSLKKIAWLVQREHSLSEKTLLTLIEALVESKDILRVHFKGAISYRIPPTSVVGGAGFEEDSFEDSSSSGFFSSSPLMQHQNRLASQKQRHSSESETEDVDMTSLNLAQRTVGGATTLQQSHRNFKPRRGGTSGGVLRGGGGGGSRGGRGTGFDSFANADRNSFGSSSQIGQPPPLEYSMSNNGGQGGSAPRPRLHAGPQVRNSTCVGTSADNNLEDNGPCSINDTISRVIFSGGVGGGGGSTSSNSSSSQGGNDSLTPKSGRSTPTMGGGSDGDEVQCLDFETPCAPPKLAPARGARRGRPPLSSLSLGVQGYSRKARPPSSRPKRAKRVFDPSEGGIIELNTSAAALLTSTTPPPPPTSTTTPGVGYTTPQYQQQHSTAAPPAGASSGYQSSVGRSGSSSGYAGFPPTTTGSGGSGLPSSSSASSGKRRRSGQQGSSESIHGDVCDLCQSPPRQQPHDYLLRCCSCPATGHPTCLGYSTVLAERCRLQPWTCMDCKLCTVCSLDHVIGTLIFCDSCDRAFHLTCHQPPLTTQPQGSWVCCYCTNTSNIGYESLLYSPGFPLTPRDSPIPDDERSRGSSGSWPGAAGGMGSYDPSIPNATHWTVDEVATHLQEKGFGDQAEVFKEQAVDGSALLLLSRSDVMQSMGLKMGPALKLFRQVRILQTRLPNPPLICPSSY